MKTFVVIPTRFKSNLLDDLVTSLHFDKSIDQIYILNNSNELYTYIDYKVQVLDFNNYSIYEMWNRIWDYIRYNYPKQELNIAFLNDDIEIQPNAIKIMAMWLRMDANVAAVYPDYDAPWDNSLEMSMRYTESTAGAGGMSGYCFMIKGELDIPFIDENLKLYWGDDDIVKQIGLKGYKIGRILGLPIKHTGSVTIRTLNPEERNKIMEADRQYFNQKYGENREPVW